MKDTRNKSLSRVFARSAALVAVSSVPYIAFLISDAQFSLPHRGLLEAAAMLPMGLAFTLSYLAWREQTDKGLLPHFKNSENKEDRSPQI